MKNPSLLALKPYSGQIVSLAISLSVSVAIVGVSYAWFKDAEAKLERAETQKRQLVLDIDQLRERQDFLAKADVSFEQVKSQGFFGDEDRLSWGEALKATAQRLKLPSLKYSIRPQMQISSVSPAYSPALILSESIMDIEAHLLHEGDFISLSEELSKLPGLFRVVDCNITKEKEIIITEPNKNISLKCSLAWHTVKYVESSESDFLEDDIDLGFM